MAGGAGEPAAPAACNESAGTRAEEFAIRMDRIKIEIRSGGITSALMIAENRGLRCEGKLRCEDRQAAGVCATAHWKRRWREGEIESARRELPRKGRGSGKNDG